MFLSCFICIFYPKSTNNQQIPKILIIKNALLTCYPITISKLKHPSNSKNSINPSSSRTHQGRNIPRIPDSRSKSLPIPLYIYSTKFTEIESIHISLLPRRGETRQKGKITIKSQKEESSMDDATV